MVLEILCYEPIYPQFSGVIETCLALGYWFFEVLCSESVIVCFTDRSKTVLLLWIVYVIPVLFLLCFRGRVFIDALWSPAGKRLNSWLAFVMSNCEVVTFPLVTWVFV